MNKTSLRLLLIAILSSVLVMSVQAQGASSYTVQPRDVLDLIALNNNVSLACLVNANDIQRPWLIYPGDELTIPANCPPYDGLSSPLPTAASLGQGGGAEASNNATTMASLPAPVCFGDPVRGRELDGNTYIVRRGDILDFIGCTFNVNTQCLAERNDLGSPAVIFPGDELVIDATCGPWVDPNRPAGQGVTEDVSNLGQGGGAEAEEVDDTAETTSTDETEDTQEAEEATDDEAAG